MLCPICNVDLLLSEKQGVEIDYCPKCRGIWLDRGELEKIIEKMYIYEKQNNTYNKVSDHGSDDDKHYYDDDHHHSDKHHEGYNNKVYYDNNGKPIRKRGGFADILGNLFD
jgi:uncharacterized protein